MLFLWCFIILNLFSIAYFKYAFFISDAVLHLDPVPKIFQDITLPLAISFFTFQQIAYLVDVWRGEVAPDGFIKHALTHIAQTNHCNFWARVSRF